MVSKPPDQGNPLNQASTPDGSMRMRARANKDHKVLIVGMGVVKFFLKTKLGMTYLI